MVASVHPFGDRFVPGSGAAFVVLVAFLVSFLAIRTSARLTRSVSWWPGGVTAEGVHLHHLVWGICLMMLCGFLAFAVPLERPWWHVVAIGFGIGAGFTIDEFALWVHLEDVYWSEEGRSSFDAFVVAGAFAGLAVAGIQPFGLDDPGSVSGTLGTVTTVLVLATICFAKARVLLGVVGLFMPLIALVVAMRLARPTSPWARRWYGEAKLRRAQKRFAATKAPARLHAQLRDLLTGAPSK